MKKILFFMFLLFAPSLYPCRHKELLDKTTGKLQRVIQRMEQNMMLTSDGITSGELIDTYKGLYYELCEECKRFADLYTEPHVKKIMEYFGLE